MTLFNGIDSLTAAGVLDGLHGVPAETIAAGLPYMRAYPVLRECVTGAVIHSDFIAAMLMVWSWIPAVLQLRPDISLPSEEAKISILRAVLHGDEVGYLGFSYLAELVDEKGFSATTKILHFARPDKYPISDGRVRSAYTRLRIHDLTLKECYDEYIRLTHRLKGISGAMDVEAFKKVLQCEGQDLTPIRLLELGLYYIGGAE